MTAMYLRTNVRRRLWRSGEVLVVMVAGFVVFAPRFDEWGLIQPLLDRFA